MNDEPSDERAKRTDETLLVILPNRISPPAKAESARRGDAGNAECLAAGEGEDHPLGGQFTPSRGYSRQVEASGECVHCDWGVMRLLSGGENADNKSNDAPISVCLSVCLFLYLPTYLPIYVCIYLTVFSISSYTQIVASLPLYSYSYIWTNIFHFLKHVLFS